MKKDFTHKVGDNIEIVARHVGEKCIFNIYENGVFQRRTTEDTYSTENVTKAFIRYKMEQIQAGPMELTHLARHNYLYTERKIKHDMVEMRIMCRNKVLKTIRSERPFSLDSQVDATTDICLFALFILFCSSFCCDADIIYKNVYDVSILHNESKKQILEIANEEGLIMPFSWDNKQVRQLMKLFTKSGYEKLATHIGKEYLS